MELKTIVPWGRSFDEYREIFGLTDGDLNKSILGCADWPSSFNAELTSRGGNVVSVDPTYRFTASELRSRIEAVYKEIMPQALDQAPRPQGEVLAPERPGPGSLDLRLVRGATVFLAL